MEAYLSKCLNRDMHIRAYLENEMLVRTYDKLYEFYITKYHGKYWIIAQLLKDINLPFLKKHYKSIKKLTGYECSFYFENASFYMRKSMFEQRIPFIVWDKQVYLPFLDVNLRVRADWRKPVCQISYLAQKLLLTAIYEEWHNMSIPSIAQRISVSTVAVHRCIDELQYLKVPVVKEIHRTRFIHLDMPKANVWANIEPVFRNPIIKTYELSEDIKGDIKSGVFALCEYGDLDTIDYPTYGVTKREFGKYRIKEREPAIDADDIQCVVHELGYCIDFQGRGLVDPLTLWMTLSDEQRKDEKIRLAMEKMLKSVF